MPSAGRERSVHPFQVNPEPRPLPQGNSRIHIVRLGIASTVCTGTISFVEASRAAPGG
jgi:hypothetical protein